eukprot:TRINITY_DN2682_c0_g1_i1.p1 TRINITY_DN2682_c0_g1~~TRINITY_DN2682_c0_g1_i1.p1  ORF type:complete len:242 (-),score=38.70 TRINITY_DN2682_c0_g1_i1:245-970(-)
MSSDDHDYRPRRGLRAEAISTHANPSSPTGMNSPDYGSGIENIDSARCLVAKVVMLGESGVGKSSIVSAYVDGAFGESKSTIGASFFTKRFAVDGMRVKLQIWDTAGQERFRSLAPMFYRGAAAAIVVFDVSNEQSYEKLKGWVSELKNNTDPSLALALAANKTDLVDQRRIPPYIVKDYAQSIGAAVFETSAKNNTGINDMFLSIAKHLVGAHQSHYSPMPSPYLGPSYNSAEPQKSGCC